MRQATILRLALMLVLAALLATGCAKQPAPTEDEAAAREEAPAVTEMPSEEIRGIDEQAIGEEQVGDEMAGQEEAAEARLEMIHFGFDQYTLTDEARQILKENAAYLEDNPGVDIRIEGHTDQVGSDEYNLALGERRAVAAKNYLVSLGIDAGRLSTISYGEEAPLDPAETEDARAKNRRAEFEIVR